MNCILKNIGVISPLDGLKGHYDLLIKDGIIENISVSEINNSDDYQIIEGKNLTCVPGFFDMHVHFREPGQTEKEDIQSGINSAVNGGFTGVLCMPNTKPPFDNPDLIIEYIQKVKNSPVDVYFSGCVTKSRSGKELTDMNLLYQSGVVCFTDDGDCVENSKILEDALKTNSKLNLPLLQHAEDKSISKNGVMNEGKISEILKLRGIPSSAETSVIKRDIDIAKKIENCKYHVQHISCAESLDIIRNCKKKYDFISCEVCPHHFILDESYCIGYNTNAKMNPPLRTKQDVDAVINGIIDNTIDVICSDHAPHTNEEKNFDFNNAPFGIIGLETSIGLSYTYLVKNSIITLETLIEKMSVNPRKILNIPQPNIKKGSLANITILNESEEWIVNSRKFKSKSRNTPFAGYKLVSKPYAVINNNQLIFSEL